MFIPVNGIKACLILTENLVCTMSWSDPTWVGLSPPLGPCTVGISVKTKQNKPKVHKPGLDNFKFRFVLFLCKTNTYFIIVISKL